MDKAPIMLNYTTKYCILVEGCCAFVRQSNLLINRLFECETGIERVYNSKTKNPTLIGSVSVFQCTGFFYGDI